MELQNKKMQLQNQKKKIQICQQSNIQQKDVARSNQNYWHYCNKPEAIILILKNARTAGRNLPIILLLNKRREWQVLSIATYSLADII